MVSNFFDKMVLLTISNKYDYSARMGFELKSNPLGNCNLNVKTNLLGLNRARHVDARRVKYLNKGILKAQILSIFC